MPKSPASANLPTVKVSPRGATRLKSGHVWVYRSDIVSADGVPPGSLVTVSDHRGKALGTALYSTSSQIAIRMISPDRSPTFPPFLRQRIADAIAYREPLVRDTDAYRVIFSEADFPPRSHRRPLQRHSFSCKSSRRHGRQPYSARPSSPN